jgi:hypothetical protein
LYEISMPLFDTSDVQSALLRAVDAVNNGRPIPKATFSNARNGAERAETQD